ncbi:hypothetical protein SAMN05444273_10970 [Litoreibacter ascidiaceicola]|uniref:Uncharacterized protein n=1 Tax=Litoreibacter ascidiaceicola TaxID=1486859 RepID=A0A1M5DJG5_9RHOB|nr:hypothetical protein [Litoreibacter ascidiaceicola]SHF67056.1 hypothetical protein SAMN05444273_10970 [Litoreibacter ascidiaceicola]
MLNRYFDTDLPFLRFCWNVLVFSAVSLFPVLLFYVVLSPGLGAMLITNEAAFVRFARQVLTNGVTVVFAVDYAGFFALALFQRQRGSKRPHYLFLDVLARALLFVLLHVLIYVLSADLFASFGGDPRVALQVVGPTLERAFLFENMSGVYLYSTLPGAFIVYLTVLHQNSGSAAVNPNTWFKSVTAIGLCAAVVVLVTTMSVGLNHSLGEP